MFNHFLQEAATLIADERLNNSAEAFRRIGDSWETVASWAKEVSLLSDPISRLPECTPSLQAIAEQEQKAWETLYPGIRRTTIG